MTAHTHDDTADSPGFLVLWPDGRIEADGTVHRLLDIKSSADSQTTLSRLLAGVLSELPTSQAPQTFDVTTASGATASLQIVSCRLDSVTVLSIDASRAEATDLAYHGLLSRALVNLHQQNAHELRGPLNSMGLHLALLGRAARGELGDMEDAQEKQQGWVDALQQAVTALSQGIDRWADLTATHAPSDSELRSNTDIRQLLIHLDMSLTPLAQKLGRQLEIEIPESSVPLEVSPPSFMRHLSALICASLEVLPETRSLQLSAALDDAEITLQASTNSVVEAESVLDDAPESEDEAPESEASESDAPESEASESEDEASESEASEASQPPNGDGLIHALISGMRPVIVEAGGRLESLGPIGWRMTWPAPKAPAEEGRDDA